MEGFSFFLGQYYQTEFLLPSHICIFQPNKCKLATFFDRILAISSHLKHQNSFSSQPEMMSVLEIFFYTPQKFLVLLLPLPCFLLFLQLQQAMLPLLHNDFYTGLLQLHLPGWTELFFSAIFSSPSTPS